MPTFSTNNFSWAHLKFMPFDTQKHGRGRLVVNPRASIIKLSANERLILNLLRTEGPASRADLARRTGLALQSIIRLIDGLNEYGYVTKTGERLVKGPGQPSLPYALVPKSAFTIGASITADTTHFILMDLAGEVLASRTFSTDGAHMEGIVTLLRDSIDNMASEASVDRERLFGVGIATTGYFVDHATVNTPVSMGEWALRDLEEEVSKVLGVPVWVENNGNAAAVGENLYGAGQSYRNFAYIYIAAGLGGGVIIDGRPMRGFNGNAGEFTGLLPISSRPDRPNLISLFEMLCDHGVEISDVGDMLARFDLDWPGVDAWVARSIDVFNAIVSAIGAVLDPEAIVVGGRLPPALAQRLASEASYYAAPVRDRERPFPIVVAAQTRVDAAALGAASIPFQEHFFG